MKTKLSKDDKALLRAKGLEFSLTFNSKKDAKRVFKRLKHELLDDRQSESDDIRKEAMDAKVVLKGKKVTLKGGQWLAMGFALDTII